MAHILHKIHKTTTQQHPSVLLEYKDSMWEKTQCSPEIYTIPYFPLCSTDYSTAVSTRSFYVLLCVIESDGWWDKGIPRSVTVAAGGLKTWAWWEGLKLTEQGVVGEAAGFQSLRMRLEVRFFLLTWHFMSHWLNRVGFSSDSSHRVSCPEPGESPTA